MDDPFRVQSEDFDVLLSRVFLMNHPPYVKKPTQIHFADSSLSLELATKEKCQRMFSQIFGHMSKAHDGSIAKVLKEIKTIMGNKPKSSVTIDHEKGQTTLTRAFLDQHVPSLSYDPGNFAGHNIISFHGTDFNLRYSTKHGNQFDRIIHFL